MPPFIVLLSFMPFSLVPSVTPVVFYQLLLPTFFVHLTRGLTVSTLPLIILENLEQSKFNVGIAVGAIGFGKIISDIPLGIVLARIGAKKLMILSGLIIATSALLSLFSVATIQSYSLLLIALFVYGVGQGAGVLSRIAMISENIPRFERGQIAALLGGSARIAMAVGPALGGLLMNLSLSLLFLTQAACAILSAVVLSMGPQSADPAQNLDSPTHANHGPLWKMKITFPLSTLLNIGVFVTGIQLIRECRKLVIPLAAIDLGMSNEDVGWYSTISYGIDAMLFSAAGIVMDKFGRNFCAVSSVSIMALSQLILVPGVSYFTLLLNAIIGGIGNGLSSGIILAYGADLAPETPPESKAQFLAYYRLIGDFGEFFGPIVVGALAQFTSTPTMINTLCTISVASIYWLIWTIPEPLTMLNSVVEVSFKPLSSEIKASQEEVVVERKDEYTS